MTNPNFSPTSIEPLEDHGQKLRDLIAAMTEITGRIARSAPNEIILLPESERAKIITLSTRYTEFEYSQCPELHNLPVTVTGRGALIFADKENVEKGSERLFEGDKLTGTVIGVSAIPIYSKEWLLRSDGTEDGYDDEVLSPALILSDARFQADPLPDEGYEVDADLSEFHIFLPLAHYLHVAPSLQ